MTSFGFWVSIIGLGLLIFIHELGHFLSGKALKLKVTEFFLGLPIGRALVKFRRGETVYGVKPVLFGGYVKFPEFLAMHEPEVSKVAKGSPAAAAGIKKSDRILKINDRPTENWFDVFNALKGAAGRTVELTVLRRGEELAFTIALGSKGDVGWLGVGPESTDEITIEDLPDTLEGQSVWRKSLVVAAGPAMNVLLAVVLMAGALMIGFAEPTTTVGRVVPRGAAEKAGIKAGDRILRIADRPTRNWESVRSTINGHAGQRVDITIQRDERKLKVSALLKKDPKKGRLGIVTKLERNPRSPVAALKEGSIFVYQATGLILEFMAKLATTPGEVVGQLRSPIGVVQETAPIAQRDILEYVVTLAGISVAIGIFNFLPIPPLDGGRIFVSAVEFAIRRPLKKEALLLINAVGVSLLLMLMTYVIVADLFRIARPGGG